MTVTWRPARSLTTIKVQINAAHPNRPTASDGMLASSAHHSANPASDHDPRLIRSEWVVCAVDITKDTWTQATINALVASRDPRIKYLIWQRRFCAGVAGWGSAPWVWVPYTGSNPHDKHWHLSVNASNCDDTRPWQIGAATQEDVMTPDQQKDLQSRIGTADMNNSTRTAAIIAAIAADPDNPVTQEMLDQAVATNNAALAVAIKAELGDAGVDGAAIEQALRNVLTHGTEGPT